MILEPEGQVRFASDVANLGRRLPELVGTAQPGVTTSRFLVSAGRGEVLRPESADEG